MPEAGLHMNIMFSLLLLSSLVWALPSSVATPAVSTSQYPSKQALEVIRRHLASFSPHRRDTVLSNTTSLDTSWNGATLIDQY